MFSFLLYLLPVYQMSGIPTVKCCRAPRGYILINQTARNFDTDFSGKARAPSRPPLHGPHIHPAREDRKPPSAAPKDPLRSVNVSYLLGGCVSPPDDKPGTLTLLSTGMVHFTAPSAPTMEFPLSRMRRWLKDRSKFGHDCKAEFAHDGSSVYLKIGDVLTFCQSCT
jgi:hypothetical protein